MFGVTAGVVIANTVASMAARTNATKKSARANI